MSTRIKEFREARGWTQQQLGDQIGQSNTNINKIETGKIELRERVIRRLADAFDVSISVLLDDSRIAEHHAPDLIGPPNPDVVQYTPPSDHPLAHLAKDESATCYQVLSDSLSQLGFLPDDILMGSNKRSTIDNVATGAIVIVEHRPVDTVDGSRLLLREFIDPNLLIVNTSNQYAPYPLLHVTDPHFRRAAPLLDNRITIVSVIEHSHRDVPKRNDPPQK